MTNEEKLELLADVFDMDAAEIKTDAKLEDMDCWDSMNKLSLIVCFSDNFGKKITQKDFSNFVTIQDILNAMEK
jgi:acyl carrier protein